MKSNEQAADENLTDNTVRADHRFSQAILDSLPAHIAVLNEDGAIIAVNKVWTRFAAENAEPGIRAIGIGVNYLEAAKRALGPYAQEGSAACLGIKAVLDGSLPEFALEYPCQAPTRQRCFQLHVTPLAERSAVLSHLDITAWKQVEANRRESEDQFRELAIHLHQVLWMIDATETKVFYISPAYEKVWGRTCQSLYDKPLSFLDAIHPEDRERVASARVRKCQTGQYKEEYRILRPDGSVRWIWDRGYPVQDEAGLIKSFVGIADDITERRESEEQFRELAIHLHQVLWMIDATETKVFYISPAYERVWGRTCQSLYDKPLSFLDAIHPQDRERVASARAEKCQTGQYKEEYRILRPDGSVRWIWDRSYPVQDEQGLVKSFVGIAEDITERKACEADQARLAAIVECSEDAIVSMTVDGIVVNWNPGAERLYGYTAEEIIGRPIAVLFTPDHYPEYLKIMEKVRKGERLPAYDTVRRRKDGTAITASVDICPIEVRDGEIVGASKIAHDITRMKQLEEQFRQAQKMQAVGRLAGGVAHDFNNLLTIISGYSEMLLNAVPPDDPKRGKLTEIKKAGERAAALTRQLLAFSRKQVLEPKVLDLNAVVANCEKMLQRLVGEDVDLVAVLDPALGRVKTDPGQIEQVLMNLVVNARDAMPQGGKLTIETANAVLDQTYCRSHAGVKPGRYIMLAVSDTGCGMDEQTKAHIFEPFFTTKEEGRGTGLGLAMVYGFIKQSEGHVYVYSEPGLGSTFKIYLLEVEAVQLSGQLPATIETTPQGSETILLVEDAAEVRSLTRQVLQTCGYTVLEAAHGGEAIRLAEKQPGPVHLLVSDVVMPEMGGRRLAERIVVLKPGIKVLYLSGYTTDAVVRHGVLESETAFLQKPFTPSALARKVREVLDS